MQEYIQEDNNRGQWVDELCFIVHISLAFNLLERFEEN